MLELIGEGGFSQRSLEVRGSLAAVFEAPKLAILDSSTRVCFGSNYVSLAKSHCFRGIIIGPVE
jgi:hypothetical protein